MGFWKRYQEIYLGLVTQSHQHLPNLATLERNEGKRLHHPASQLVTDIITYDFFVNMLLHFKETVCTVLRVQISNLDQSEERSRCQLCRLRQLKVTSYVRFYFATRKIQKRFLGLMRKGAKCQTFNARPTMAVTEKTLCGSIKSKVSYHQLHSPIVPIHYF